MYVEPEPLAESFGQLEHFNRVSHFNGVFFYMELAINDYSLLCSAYITSTEFYGILLLCYVHLQRENTLIKLIN